MSVLEDILKALELVPKWKRIGELPKEMEELQERVRALEELLANAKGDRCPKCRELTFTIQSSGPAPGALGRMAGWMQNQYACSACGYTKTDTIQPKQG
jgi:hypothetical protein